MFPPEKNDNGKALIIYAGHKISTGIQLIVDKVWRYKLQNNEQLTVQLRALDDTVKISKVYTAADVDDIDRIVTVTFDGNDTNLPEGDYYLVATVDDYVVFPPVPVKIREVVYHG